MLAKTTITLEGIALQVYFTLRGGRPATFHHPEEPPEVDEICEVWHEGEEILPLLHHLLTEIRVELEGCTYETV